MFQWHPLLKLDGICNNEDIPSSNNLIKLEKYFITLIKIEDKLSNSCLSNKLMDEHPMLINEIPTK